MTDKIISKLLCSRLSALPKLIFCTQSGFVADRQIGDDILLAQELTHSIDRKCKDRNLIMKLDMTKAYDRVHRNWFSMIVNGQSLGFFHSEA